MGKVATAGVETQRERVRYLFEKRRLIPRDLNPPDSRQKDEGPMIHAAQ
jgi:hypothetical protein